MIRVSLALLEAHAFRFGGRGVCAIPHSEKANRGGEDAFFIHSNGIGVADGVGGYSRSGINPAIFTRNVMKNSLQALEKDKDLGAASALDVLNVGFHGALASGAPGGCPATLVTLMNGRFASVLNLGDCCTLCVRQGNLLFRTFEQQHSFNCPYQLPTDIPSDGELAKLEVHEHDIFMCTSDGVMDNVEVNDILAILDEIKTVGCSGAAEKIAKIAERNGKNPRLHSPFARSAAKHGYRYVGGKEDDITVVVAEVRRVDAPLDPCVALMDELFPLEG